MPVELDMPPPPLSAPRSGLGPSRRDRDGSMLGAGTPPHSYRDGPAAPHYNTSLRSSSQGEAAWASRGSPRLDDRIASDGPAHRGKPDMDRLPPVSAIDPALSESHKGPTSVDIHGRRLSGRSQTSQDHLRGDGAVDAGNGAGHARSYSARDNGTGRAGIEMPRSHLRGTQQGSGSSNEWDSGSDRGGSPPRAPDRGYAPADDARAYVRPGNGYRQRRGSGAGPSYGYTEAYSAPPSASAGVSSRPFTDAGYEADRHDVGPPVRRGESPSSYSASARPLKRKPSFDEGPGDSRRPHYTPRVPSSTESASRPLVSGRDRPDERDERDGRSALRDYHYHDRQALPRSSYARGGIESPGREPRAAYPSAYDAPYSSATASRYAAGEAPDSRYSPHVQMRSPVPALPPTVPSDGYGRGAGRYGPPYDAAPAPGIAYADRRTGGRYSPVASPSYARRTLSSSVPVAPGLPMGAAPPLAPAEYYGTSSGRGGSLRQRSPPYAGDESRPHLPHPVSASSVPPGPHHYRGRRESPPVEMLSRRSPSPRVASHLMHEPFYPDRRFFYPRERIEDVEIDEYYHDGPGRSRVPSYHVQDPYGPPPGPSYLPPAAAGMGGHHPHLRAHPVGVPVGVPPPPPGQRGHHDLGPHGGLDYDPRDLPPPNRPQNVVGIPPPHVPPGPSTGIAPPPRRRGKLPKPVTDLLKAWLLEHASHPYPTEDEKRSLCSMTGLTLQQVSNWFINARRRILLPGGGGSGGGATAEQVKAAFQNDSPSPPGSDA